MTAFFFKQEIRPDEVRTKRAKGNRWRLDVARVLYCLRRHLSQAMGAFLSLLTTGLGRCRGNGQEIGCNTTSHSLSLRT